MLTQEMKDYYSGLQSCCLDKDTKKRVEDVEECLLFKESIPDECNGYALCRQKDGTFIVFYEWQDYTGHGCQCDCGSDGPFQSKEEAIRLGIPETAYTFLEIAKE